MFRNPGSVVRNPKDDALCLRLDADGYDGRIVAVDDAVLEEFVDASLQLLDTFDVCRWLTPDVDLTVRLIQSHTIRVRLHS